MSREDSDVSDIGAIAQHLANTIKKLREEIAWHHRCEMEVNNLLAKSVDRDTYQKFVELAKHQRELRTK